MKYHIVKNIEGDLLNRAPIIENLTNLAVNIPKPFVLSISAPWGFGKTHFINLWKNSLHDNEYITFLYNAWENDQKVDPIVSIIAEIEAQSKSNEHIKEVLGKSTLLKELKDKSIELVQNVGPTLVKLATLGSRP